MRVYERRELEEMPADDLAKLYKEHLLFRDELEYFREYNSQLLEDKTSSQAISLETFQDSPAAAAREVVETEEAEVMTVKERLLNSEKIKILKKLREIQEIKYSSKGLGKRVINLQSELKSTEILVDLVYNKDSNNSNGKDGEEDLSKAESAQKLLQREKRRRENLIDNLNLEKISLMKRLTKFRKDLNETDGDSGRTMMDYHSLCIENSEYQRSINRLTGGVTNAKNDCAKLIARVNEVKQKLSAEVKQANGGRRDFETKSRIERKLNEEAKTIEESLEEIESDISQIRTMKSEWETPEVFDYVQCCQQLRQLKKSKSLYEYKLNLLLQNSTLKSNNSK